MRFLWRHANNLLAKITKQVIIEGEKRTAHYKLALVKAMIEAGKVRTTMMAREGAASLGFDFDGMLAVFMALTAADFYKRMTTHADHRVWQDVYRPRTTAGEVYGSADLFRSW